jgi:uncharacterized protein YjbI with pentapeptide repeats
VAFGAGANFAGATFGNWAELSDAKFDSADFHVLKLSTLLDHHLPFSAWPEKRKEEFLATYEALFERGAGPDGFGSISFANAHFGSRVYFAGRKFFSHGDFTGASFAEPPTFDRCENTGRLNLYGARITFSRTLFGFIPEWTTDSDVGIRLRLLRKIADETQTMISNATSIS